MAFLDLKKQINKLLEAVKVDYVVEEGTSGIWTYRKWNSGIAECWGRYQYSTTGTTQWGGTYYNTPTASIAFPTSFFLEAPVVSALQVSNRIQGMVAVSSVDTTTANLYNVRGASSGSGTLIFSVHAIGRWK